MISTFLRLTAAKKVESGVVVGGRVYPTSSPKGRILEQAIAGSHAVAGIHKPEQTVIVHDDNSGARVQYPIVRDKFLSLLAGYSVRDEVSHIFS